MKDYLLTVAVLLSLAVNTVVGMTVFQQSEPSVRVAENAHSSMVSGHQDHPDESDNAHPHDCGSEIECHDGDVCCKTLCDVPYVILPPNVKPASQHLKNVKSNDYPSKLRHSSAVPISPD